MLSSLFAFGFLGLSQALLQPRQDFVHLSTEEITAYKPYTLFASIAYCDSTITGTWTCGTKCGTLSDFKPFSSGGDGAKTQFWFVGYSPSLHTIIVAHEGTDFRKFESGLKDADIHLEPLDPSLFPGFSGSIEVHRGFKNAQSDTANAVLSAVDGAMKAFDCNIVTITGHSLGASIALLDAVYLSLHLPERTEFRVIGYGMPRVGNQAFVDYVDSKIRNLTRINNKKDIVPILPGRFLGYRHPSGEIHIADENQWVRCPGQDNDSNQCSRGAVSTIFSGVPDDHSGPYDGVMMGC